MSKKETNTNEEILNEEILNEEILNEGDSADVESETDETADEPIEAETAGMESSDEVLEDEEAALAMALVKAEEALKESQDRYARTMAEFDNFRKRTLREKSEMHERGAKEVLEKLLAVVDNFERAIGHITEEEKELAITKGVEMIYKQLMGVLTEIGVEEIEALNQTFDPNLHHAVSHEDNEDYDENMVQDVFQKGYMYKDAVLRHSMVKVVN